MPIKPMVEVTTSDLITSDFGNGTSDDVATIERPALVVFSNIFPAYVLRILALLFAISLISATPPVFSIDKPEDHMIFVAGFEAYQQKNYATALKNFNKLLDKYPDTPLLDLALFWISRTNYKIGNQLEAARNMSQLIKQYPDTPMLGVVEDDLLELVARYDNGERLPSKTVKENVKIATPLKSSKPEASTPAASCYNSKTPTTDSIQSAPTPTKHGVRNDALKHNVKPTIPENTDFVTVTPIWVNPAEINAGETSKKSVPTPKIERSASVASQTKSSLYIKEIVVGESFIDIVTGNRQEAYKIFRLTQPDRLVIDIPGARSAIAAKSVPINRLGISKARIGINLDAVRIVLDSAQSAFPTYDIKPFESGLRISLKNAKVLEMPTEIITAGKSMRPVPTPKMEQPAPVAKQDNTGIFIKEIVAGESYIDIITGNRLAAYKIIKLIKPDRLVIDIPGAKSLLTVKSIMINRLGITNARIGINPDAVRIVLDTALSKFPKYGVKSIENGLRININ